MQSPSTNASVRDLIDRHARAFAAGDLDTLMATYHDDAVVMSSRGNVVTGVDDLRAAFAQVPPAMFAGYEPIVELIGDDLVYVTWRTDAVPFATDTFVVRDGLIARQTITIAP